MVRIVTRKRLICVQFLRRNLRLRCIWQVGIINPFPHKPLFSRTRRIDPILRKTLWKKRRNCLLQAISPFFHNVFYHIGSMTLIFFPVYTHFEMSSATSFKLDKSEILSSGNGVRSEWWLTSLWRSTLMLFFNRVSYTQSKNSNGATLQNESRRWPFLDHAFHVFFFFFKSIIQKFSARLSESDISANLRDTLWIWNMTILPEMVGGNGPAETFHSDLNHFFGYLKENRNYVVPIILNGKRSMSRLRILRKPN